MSVPLLAVFLALSAQGVEMTVDVANNAVIAGLKTFRVTVSADDPITQVEFYVGDELRDSDSSIPYEFKLDTIEENDGPMVLTFAAYTSRGESAKKILRVSVDNGLSKGAEFHAQVAMELVQDSKWDEAIQAGRIALKADPESPAARMAMARAYMGKGVWDKAQKYAEDLLAATPDSDEAKGLVAGISTLRALRTFDRGTDRSATLKAIAEALETGIDTRKKILEAQFEAIGPPTASNLISYVDAALRARRYSAVIQELAPRVRREATDNRLSNRLAFAQLSAGKQPDALHTLNQVEKFGKLDAYGLSMKAVLHAVAGDREGSARYIKEAMLSDSTDLAVRCAQAYLALHSGRYDSAAQLVDGLQRDYGARAETHYYAFVVLNTLGNYEQSRQFFERVILAEPLFEAIYVEQGKKNLAFAADQRVGAENVEFQVDAAEAMFRAAYKVRPESFQAVAGLAICRMLKNDVKEAHSYAEAAVRVANYEPAGYFLLSGAQEWLANTLSAEADQLKLQAATLRSSGDTYQASQADTASKSLFSRSSQLRDAAIGSVRKAGELDPVRLGGHSLPKVPDTWRYFQLTKPVVLPMPR